MLYMHITDTFNNIVRFLNNNMIYLISLLGAIQVFRNAEEDGRVSDFPGKNVTKMYLLTILALRRGGWVSNFQKKSVT